MNPNHEMNRLQRLLTILGTAGAATLMTLPVLAQNSTTNSGVLNPNPSIFNEAPYNRSTTGVTPSAVPSTTGQTSDRCAPYTQGGIGGTADPATSQATPSTQQGGASYSSSSDAAAVPGSTNSYPNQSGSFANQRDRNAGLSTNTSSGVQSSNVGSSDRVVRRQFDANNRSAAIAYRTNGPAGTAGHEVKMNLDEVREVDESPVPLASNQTTYTAPSNLSAAPLPAECAP